jgi:hypothetical protein
MRRLRDRTRRLLMLLPLFLAVVVAGCESATGPKFPEPSDEPGDSTIEEGVRASRAAIRVAPEQEVAMVALVPAFQPAGAP